MMMLTTALAGTAGGDRSATNPLLAALLGGTASGLIAAATGLLLGMQLPALYVLAFFLIGAGPVLGSSWLLESWARIGSLCWGVWLGLSCRSSLR
ncbi:MAG: hypothetical protein ACKO4U_04830 [Caldilinea sp.]